MQVKESMKVFMLCSYVELRVVRCLECYDQIINLWIKSLVLQASAVLGDREATERWLLDGLFHQCSTMEFSNDIVIG